MNVGTIREGVDSKQFHNLVIDLLERDPAFVSHHQYLYFHSIISELYYQIIQKQRKMPWRDRKNHLDLFETFFLFYETWDCLKSVDQEREGADLKQLDQLNVMKLLS